MESAYKSRASEIEFQHEHTCVGCLMASVARYKFVPSMIHEQDDVFLQVLDEDSILTELRDEMCPTKRISILESLRMSVRRSGGQLHIQERFSLFNAINNILLDNDVNTRLANAWH